MRPDPGTSDYQLNTQEETKPRYRQPFAIPEQRKVSPLEAIRQVHGVNSAIQNIQAKLEQL